MYIIIIKKIIDVYKTVMFDCFNIDCDTDLLAGSNKLHVGIGLA